ncbi:serine/threonine dehydratase [Gordonia metallireducens]|uniref:serine/threonine dehydratase n=1 Tax=Gordonia metallireducens TaxID=2897779 RepID=UPI001E49E42F|nr:serine/threonine dehydratase [Gordonia metallireducens]
MRATRADVDLAAATISPLLRRTPTLRTVIETVDGPRDVVFKLEYLQLGGCFKVRGSLSATLHARARGALTDAGVLVASGGNAAIGAAWAARIAGVPCTVVIPETAPEVKVQTLRTLGAQVHLVGLRYQDAADAAGELAATTGALPLHAYDLPDIVAGAGTIGLEMTEDVPDPLTTVVCVGGGGLLAGLAATLRPGDRLVGVEPLGASCLHQARAAGSPVPVELESVAADSLGATRVGDICWETAAQRPDVDSVLVTDAQLIDARRMLWDSHRILVEHGTAAAVAAVTTGAVRPEPDSTLCIVLCGANTGFDL